MKDLTYIQEKIFTKFIPNTKAGEEAWNVMQKDGVASVYNQHAEDVIKQLTDAGYTVEKSIFHCNLMDSLSEEDFELLDSLGG